MKACGLIVEYNPFHNGHIYHLNESRRITQADCLIAVMSGSFLQRGEPAIVDKFSRAKSALKSGVDIVLELPYAYSVQSSTLFSHGAIKVLNALKIDSLCFGSESGSIKSFINNFHVLKNNKNKYDSILKRELAKGYSYPLANNLAYQDIGFNLDVLKPNNILGFNYVNEILLNELPIELHTIKRTNNAYHDIKLSSKISSATSIRKEILTNGMTQNVKASLPPETIHELNVYKHLANTYHVWENYFELLQYKVLSSSRSDLSRIALVDEGLHNRIKDTAQAAESFNHWMHLIKTKRYTWVKIQRIFTHILTSTTQSEVNNYQKNFNQIRLLGMTKQGQAYLNKIKNKIDVNIISSLKSFGSDSLESKVSDVYYTAVSPTYRKDLVKQEYAPPIIIE